MNEKRETFQTKNIFLTEPFHKIKNNLEIHSHEFVIQNKDKNGNSIFLVFFIHSQPVYPFSELDMLFKSELDDDFLETFLTNHLYDKPNLFYKTKHSKIIILPSIVRMNSLSNFSSCSRKQLKKKYKDIYDTDFYEPIFSLFRTRENDNEPYESKILAQNFPVKTQLIVEGFSVTYQECQLLKDDRNTVYKDAAVVPLGANAYANGVALFTNFLYFLIIFLIVCAFCPYFTISGIAIKNNPNLETSNYKYLKYSNVFLCVINYCFLIIGFILITVGLVTPNKKMKKSKRILLANLGLYFIIIFVCSLFSNIFAYNSKVNYGGDLDFGKIQSDTASVLNIIGFGIGSKLN